MNHPVTSHIIPIWNHLLDVGAKDAATFFIEALFEHLEFVETLGQGSPTDELIVLVRQWLMEILEDHDGHKLPRWYDLFRNNREEFRLVARGFVATHIQPV